MADTELNTAAAPEGALPPLPVAFVKLDSDDDNVWGAIQSEAWVSSISEELFLDAPLFTTKQMQAYARAAVEADRAQQGEPVGEIVAADPVHGWHMHALIPWEEIGAGTKLYRAATKAPAPADCVACEGKPSAENNPCAVCQRAAPVPDTGIPAAEQDEQEHVLPPFAAPAGKHDAGSAVLADDEIKQLGVLMDVDAFQDEAFRKSQGKKMTWPEQDALSKQMGLIRAVEAAVASRCRAQGGITKDNDNFRAPVSGTPTSGEKP